MSDHERADSTDSEVTRILPLTPSPSGVSAAPAAAAPATRTGAPTSTIRSSTSSLPGHAPPPSDTWPGADAPTGPLLRQVGRYRINERLGRGGMATVFKAHDPDIGRDVAIKFLHASLCADAEYHSRFLREARAAGSLSHPNIVTVHDVGEIDGRPYMAMELLDGQPLSAEMANARPLPLREVVVMGIQIARALAYAHARGIVHRDIKPGNLMRVKDTLTIKVTDFGIAHMESGGACCAGTEHRTVVGAILGTPQYMSPEQARGEKLDGRSDLFATGVVLYQMLTGQRPFLGDSLVALALQITRDTPIPIETLRPDLPASLRRIVERCLAKAPERRFQTGDELSAALGRVLSELDELERRHAERRVLPLRVKWAALMGLLVAVVMACTATLITQRQQAALMAQMVDSGAALARFIAAQNAVAALSEDWIPVDVAVQEIMKTGDFQSIDVIDRAGIVRASSLPARVGLAYPQALPALTPTPSVAAAGARAPAVPVTHHSVNGEAVLGFEAPITFQNKRVGWVALGLREQPLEQLARLSNGLMAVLVVVTVLAVAVATYFAAKGFAEPIKLVGAALDEIAMGRFEHRLGELRKDEFGALYAAFDRMAQALQDRQAGMPVGALSAPAPPPPPPTPPTSPTSSTSSTPAMPPPVPGLAGTSDVDVAVAVASPALAPSARPRP